MSKIITDAKQVDEVLTRGVENIYPDKKTLRELLLSSKQITLYCGYDPTATTLHLGHIITMRKLQKLAELGHKVIFLFGDFTAQIGDPDKLSVRKPLTHEQVLHNLKTWKEQIKNFIDLDKIDFQFNSQWLAQLSFTDLIGIAQNFTVQQMLDRDMFQQRIADSRPIYLHEFFYPLMQAYDCVAMDVDLEIGGNDQTFNMLAGRTLLKAMKQKDKCVMTIKLLADNAGAKMGKTTGNMAALTDTPEDMFGKIMSWTDGMIAPGFELLTDVPTATIQDIVHKMASGELNPRNAKDDLAYEIIKLVLGEKAAQKGRGNFKLVFQDKQKPLEIPEATIQDKDGRIGVLDLFVQAGLAKSNNEVKRLIKEKAIRIDDELITNDAIIVKIPPAGLLLQRGKKLFAKARLK